uniref:Uncharacterized protein n=1 Tax=Cacopsylla melanoneura TaxID=428564 RepID=A0A8D8LGA5_9HEMI
METERSMLGTTPFISLSLPSTSLLHPILLSLLFSWFFPPKLSPILSFPLFLPLCLHFSPSLPLLFGYLRLLPSSFRSPLSLSLPILSLTFVYSPLSLSLP